MADAQLTILDPKSLVLVTPVVKNAAGDAIGKGSPVEVPMADFIAYVATQLPPAGP